MTEQPYQYGRDQHSRDQYGRDQHSRATVPGQAPRSVNLSAPASASDQPGPGQPAPLIPDTAAIRPNPPVAALTGLTLLAGLGGWLVAAPFLLGDQVRGAAWTTATRVDVGAGALLTLIALTGLLGYLGAAIGWSARYARN